MKHKIQIKLIQLLVMSLDSEKITLSLVIGEIGVDCVFTELRLVS